MLPRTRRPRDAAGSVGRGPGRRLSYLYVAGAPGEGRSAQPGQATTRRQDWREELLEVLMSVPPDAFERLSQRLLREAGFISATVTGPDGRRRH